MYGKHFESMYEGSMYGAGVAIFAVWGYVIAHTKESVVELNPRLLADTLGGEVKDMEGAIEFLCSPDPQSRHKEAEGRRLVKEGEFQYRVPSWQHYRLIMNEEDRRVYNRLAKQRERERKRVEEEARKKKGKRGKGPGAREVAYVAAMEGGASEEELGRMVAPAGGAESGVGVSGEQANGGQDHE